MPKPLRSACICMITFLFFLNSIKSQFPAGFDIDEEDQQRYDEEDENSNELEQKDFNQETQQALEELNLHKKESITKAEFGKVLHLLLSNHEVIEYEEGDISSKLISKFIQDLPDNISQKDIFMYMSLKKIRSILGELSMEVERGYGEDLSDFNDSDL